MCGSDYKSSARIDCGAYECHPASKIGQHNGIGEESCMIIWRRWKYTVHAGWWEGETDKVM